MSFRRLLVVPMVFALCACSDTSDRAEAAAAAAKNQKLRPAPDFALKDADGRQVALSDYKGKVVLLNFWATWCGPCKVEIPWFVDFEQKYRDKGFAVIGVSMDEDGWGVVKPYMAERKINYRILLGDDKVAQAYGGVDSLPTSFIIDREGRITSTHVGLVSKSEYENAILKLLGGSSAGVVGEPASLRSAD